MDYESFTLTEMSAACGGVIEGIDLSKELTNAQFNEIHSALLDRTVIIFRDQKISSHQQVAFSRRFGEPQPAAVSGFEKSPDYPEIDILEYDSENHLM